MEKLAVIHTVLQKGRNSAKTPARIDSMQTEIKFDENFYHESKPGS